jgi:hypothetical protein
VVHASIIPLPILAEAASVRYNDCMGWSLTFRSREKPAIHWIPLTPCLTPRRLNVRST